MIIEEKKKLLALEEKLRRRVLRQWDHLRSSIKQPFLLHPMYWGHRTRCLRWPYRCSELAAASDDPGDANAQNAYLSEFRAFYANYEEGADSLYYREDGDDNADYFEEDQEDDTDVFEEDDD